VTGAVKVDGRDEGEVSSTGVHHGTTVTERIE